MPLVLRKIRKAKWYKSRSVPWLSESDLQADALVDLSSKGNTLSVFLINDQRTNLEQVVTALAANSNVIWDFEYALFSLEALSTLGIETEYSEGDTADIIVNGWHCDLVELSSTKIMGLATIIRDAAEKETLTRKQVLRLVAQGMMAQQLDRSRIKLKEEELEKLDQLVASQELGF